MTRRLWTLYRLYTRDGRPLYTGITSRPIPERFAEHAATKPWWHLVDHSRTQTEALNNGHPLTRRQAETLEAQAIRDTPTLANNDHNYGRGNNLNGRLTSGHPDPTNRHLIGGPPPGADLLELAIRAAPWALAAATIAAIAAANR